MIVELVTELEDAEWRITVYGFPLIMDVGINRPVHPVFPVNG